MSFAHVQDPCHVDGLRRDLASARRLALDCEAAGFHRYSDRLCLLQLSTEAETYVLDTLAFDPSDLLREVLEDPSVPIVMHGADYDLRLLLRDLGIRVRGLFDTQIAAALLGERALGLQALLESRLGVTLSKKYQRADWAERPLTDGMLEYAADDTRHLLRLGDLLAASLNAAGRHTWAAEECRALEESATAPAGADAEPEDPVTRVRGARDLTAREVTALREALEWRDRLARERDKAPFRVVGDQPLLEAVLHRPLDARELAAIKGFPASLARGEGLELLRHFDRVAQLPDEELRPYPRNPRRGPPRTTPDAEELAERLKAVRNRLAEEMGLDRGILMANAVVQAIAVERPESLEALARVEGIHAWQVEVLGRALLEVVVRRR
jgi:ribonuclease D